tara:strand:+ start:2136 stop:2351 length:216 start_codon:yes stop_codon:yes gene_type:complete
MNNKEYFNFIYDSTLIGNLNTGQGTLPNMYSIKQKVEPMANSQKIVYNGINNITAKNTQIQSNYMNLKGIK